MALSGAYYVTLRWMRDYNSDHTTSDHTGHTRRCWSGKYENDLFRVVLPKRTMVKQGDCGNAACEAVTFDKWCGFSGPTPRRISYIGLYLHPAKPDICGVSSAGRATGLHPVGSAVRARHSAPFLWKLLKESSCTSGNAMRSLSLIEVCRNQNFPV